MGVVVERATLAAVQVPDGVFEPYRFCLALLATAQANRAQVRTFAEVVDLDSTDGYVTGVTVVDRLTGRFDTLRADLVINASGRGRSTWRPWRRSRCPAARPPG